MNSLGHPSLGRHHHHPRAGWRRGGTYIVSAPPYAWAPYTIDVSQQGAQQQAATDEKVAKVEQAVEAAKAEVASVKKSNSYLKWGLGLAALLAAFAIGRAVSR